MSIYIYMSLSIYIYTLIKLSIWYTIKRCMGCLESRFTKKIWVNAFTVLKTFGK